MFIPDTDYEAYQTRKRQERQQAATPAPEAPDFWNVPNTGPLVPSPTGMDGPAPLSFVPSPTGMDGPAGQQPPVPDAVQRAMRWRDELNAAKAAPKPSINEAIAAAQARGDIARDGPFAPKSASPLETLAASAYVPGMTYSRGVSAPIAEVFTQMNTVPKQTPGFGEPAPGPLPGLRRPLLPAEQQNIGDVWQGASGDNAVDKWGSLGERFQKRYETDPWGSMAVEGMVDPANAFGMGLIKGAGAVAKGLGGAVARGVTGPSRAGPAAAAQIAGRAVKQFGDGAWAVAENGSRVGPLAETATEAIKQFETLSGALPKAKAQELAHFKRVAELATSPTAKIAKQQRGLADNPEVARYAAEQIKRLDNKPLMDELAGAARATGRTANEIITMPGLKRLLPAASIEDVSKTSGRAAAETSPTGPPPRGIDDVASIPSSSGASRAIPPEGLPQGASRGTTSPQLPARPLAEAGQRTSIESAGTPPPRVPPVADDADSIVSPVRGYPAKKAGFEQAWNRDRNVMEHQGEAGRQLAARIHESREIAHQKAGDWISRMPTLRQLDKAAFDNFVDVAEGKAPPRTAQIEKAAQEWAAIREEVWATAKNAGLPVGEIKNYFPHRYDPKLFKGTDRWNKMIDHLVASKQAATRTEAEQMLDKFKEANFTRFGNLERERIVDLPGFERTPQALMDYIYGSAKRIGQATQFGPENEIGARLITEIGRQGGDTGAAQDILHRLLGTKEYGENMEKIARVATVFNVITKMGTATIANATQPTNTATVAGLFRTIKHIPEALVSKEAKDYALRIGVTVDGVVKDAREGAGWSTKAGQLAVPFFNAVEKFNRTLTAVVGREFAQDMAKRWVKSAGTDAEAGRALGAMKLDPASIMARKGKLSLKEETQASRNIVERTQFYVDSQDLPGWTDSPWGKVVRQFRTFQYNQSAFMAREILQPAINNHNFKPLATFVLMGLPAGATAYELKNLLKNRPSEEDPVQRVRQYFQQVGGFGVVGDLLGGFAPPNSKYLPGERYALQAASTAFGPSMGTVLEGAGVAALASQGKPDSLKRFIYKQIPVVGQTVKNTLMPYKPGGRGGELTPLQRRMQQAGSGLTPLQKRMQQAGGR